ncbi:MAG: hypothetical protein WCP14_04155 [bacterium]
MIYIIGGPPRCGKTTLARRLSKKLNIGWLSGDTFEGIVRPYVSKEEYPRRFPKNILRETTNNTNDEMYTKYSVAEILDSYLVQGLVAQHAMEVLIEEMIKEKLDFILEGYHLYPEFVRKMMTKYGKNNFRVIFLVKDNYEVTLESLMASNLEDDWVHNKSNDKKIIKVIAKFILEFSKYYKNEANEYGLKVVKYTGNIDEFMQSAESILIKKENK